MGLGEKRGTRTFTACYHQPLKLRRIEADRSRPRQTGVGFFYDVADRGRSRPRSPDSVARALHRGGCVIHGIQHCSGGREEAFADIDRALNCMPVDAPKPDESAAKEKS